MQNPRIFMPVAAASVEQSSIVSKNGALTWTKNQMRKYLVNLGKLAILPICALMLFIVCIRYFESKSEASLGPTWNGPVSINNILLVNSAAGNPSNAAMTNIVNGVTNFQYPVWISNTTTSASQYLCLTPVNINGLHHVALQFTVQPVTGNVSAGATNCVWEIVKSVTGGPTYNLGGTNALGSLFGAPTNTYFAVLGYVTNIFASGTGFSTSIASYSDVPRTVATPTLSTDEGIAGVNMLYILGVTLAGTNGITNYAVIGNGEP